MLLRMLRSLWNGSPETLGRALAARPAGVSRREFLRAAGVTTTTVAMGGMTGSLWVPERKLLTDAASLAGAYGAPGPGPCPSGPPGPLGPSFPEGWPVVPGLPDPNASVFAIEFDAAKGELALRQWVLEGPSPADVKEFASSVERMIMAVRRYEQPKSLRKAAEDQVNKLPGFHWEVVQDGPVSMGRAVPDKPPVLGDMTLSEILDEEKQNG